MQPEEFFVQLDNILQKQIFENFSHFLVEKFCKKNSKNVFQRDMHPKEAKMSKMIIFCCNGPKTTNTKVEVVTK